MEFINNGSTPAPRLPLHIRIEYKRSYARQITNGFLKNISITGAFLETGDPELRPLDKLTLEFQVSGRLRKIQASVIWSNTAGVGIKFHPFNNRDVQIVDDLMYFVKSKQDNKRSVLDSIFKQVA